MLQINALKLEINTSDGLYGTLISFSKGLNIIQANNTTGKSTLFQSILYALGFEELIGGKNEKTMQSVLKDEVIGEDNTKHKVLQSFVLLEIQNKEIITIKRSVTSEKRKSVLVDVIRGPYLTRPNGIYSTSQMYVHYAGSASYIEFGFHAFLEEFLGWDLPSVISNSGDFVKLHLPLIAPAFIIEQKMGWSTFFATQPYYNIRYSDARVVEFLLNLDVFQNERKKQVIQSDKRIIEEKWSFIYNEFKKLGDKSSAELVGMDPFPMIVNNIEDVYLRAIKKEKAYLLPELIDELSVEYRALDGAQTKDGIDIERSQVLLETLTTNLNRYGFWLDQLITESFHEKEKLKQYILQKKGVEDDLHNNKIARKMYSLGAELPTSLASNICPTCGSIVNDSLLPKGTGQIPMQIDENISFLEAQRKMIDVFIQGQRKILLNEETRISDYKNQISGLRAQIRVTKKDLVSDERMPSEAEIEQRLTVRKQIEFYSSTLESVEALKDQVKELSKEWVNVLATEKNLPKDFFSSTDRIKLTSLQQNLVALLGKFNYTSKERDAIRISYEKYLPVIEVQLGNGKSKSYDIRFDSSGSDLIRCLWAYYVALLKTSKENNGCHPDLLIFDEPQQQSASTKDFHDFLSELAGYSTSQVIVFASFQNSDEDFAEATESIKFNLIKGDKRFVKKLAIAY